MIGKKKPSHFNQCFKRLISIELNEQKNKHNKNKTKNHEVIFGQINKLIECKNLY